MSRKVILVNENEIARIPELLGREDSTTIVDDNYVPEPHIIAIDVTSTMPHVEVKRWALGAVVRKIGSQCLQMVDAVDPSDDEYPCHLALDGWVVHSGMADYEEVKDESN